MEKRKLLLPPYNNLSPEATSGVLSRRTFCWILPLLKHGFKKMIDFEDLYPVDPSLASEKLQRDLHRTFIKGSFPYLLPKTEYLINSIYFQAGIKDDGHYFTLSFGRLDVLYYRLFFQEYALLASLFRNPS